MNIAVILAGGRGVRLGGDIPKQMLNLGGKPVIAWAVDTFHKHDSIDKIIIVSEKNTLNQIRELFPGKKYTKILSFIEGGDERSDSSYNAIICSEFGDDDIFLIHDAARPFISPAIITKVIDEVKVSGACGTYIYSTDTVAIIKDSEIHSIPERKSVYSAQTPQGFRYSLLRKAHDFQRLNKIPVTDDVSLLFNIGVKVSVINGSEFNIKITNPIDFKFAEYLISGGFIK